MKFLAEPEDARRHFLILRMMYVTTSFALVDLQTVTAQPLLEGGLSSLQRVSIVLGLLEARR